MHFSCWEKLGFGLLIAAWVAFGANYVGNAMIHVQPLAEAAYKVEVGAAEEAPATEAASAEESALTLLAAADAGKGAKTFKKCVACHSNTDGAKHKVGPNLWDVVGRAKAGAAGYNFSGALKGIGGDWSFADLDQFLASPKSYAKGTKMGFAGLKKASDRAAVMAYLRSLSATPQPLP